MSIILKGKASWYSATDEGGNANVAMMSARECPECKGNDPLTTVRDALTLHKNCERCNGDGKLINQMPFNPQGMEAAMPLSLIEKHGLRFGQLVKVRHYNVFGLLEIIIRLVDIGPSEKLCSEGRIIDLTEGAFSQLEDPSKGLIPVEIEVK